MRLGVGYVSLSVCLSGAVVVLVVGVIWMRKGEKLQPTRQRQRRKEEGGGCTSQFSSREMREDDGCIDRKAEKEDEIESHE
ncbi:hypothetical protein DL95DRAFT_161017 [Leptodontidium sp. 2 PMI_412]|nr:hypothetical protein DL95DRAFT_161017 [Leptodontidium sp. 2 PMI_412]